MDAVNRMLASMTGLSVGDAFGECFFDPVIVAERLPAGRLPPPPWPWTDDTNMALSIVAVLLEGGAVDQELLAQSFGDHFDPWRGYGRAMHDLLPRYARGADWRTEARRLFNGLGSYGNGAAMRVAPLGAFFADDPKLAVIEARKSAEVTHAHPEGIAGAMAVAAAAAIAASGESGSLVERVVELAPPSEVRDRLEQIQGIEPGSSLVSVVAVLGNGSRITAQDTVAFTVWAAAQHLDDYEAALWLTARARGDVDTTCAIVGGVVGGRVGEAGIPETWRQSREPLPEWAPLR